MTNKSPFDGLTRRGALKGAIATAAVIGSGSKAVLAQNKKFNGKELVFASWGGQYQDSQKTSYADPFTAQTGAKVIQDGPTDEARIRTMVELGNPVWDVVEVSLTFYFAGASQGLFEKLDTSQLDIGHMPSQYIQPYGIGDVVTSYNVAYDKSAFPSGKYPRSWADIFDLSTFPGKRGLWNRATPCLEAALLADGVPKDKLYPIDLDRAFKKLNSIRDHTIFWDSHPKSQQLIVDGEITCGGMNNGRVYATIVAGAKNIAIEWNEALLNAGFLVIPKGSKRTDVAHGFLNAAMRPENQAKLADLTSYAPTNPDAIALVKPDIVPWLTTAGPNMKNAVTLRGDYWAENNKRLTDAWNQWKMS
jgi:putative spermidine/putrescine transport system substrate-binding protein